MGGISLNELKLEINAIDQDIINLRKQDRVLKRGKYKLIEELQSICTHDVATVIKEIDYDRSRYTVRCNECEKLLLGYENVFRYREFAEIYKGQLVF